MQLWHEIGELDENELELHYLNVIRHILLAVMKQTDCIIKINYSKFYL